MNKHCIKLVDGKARMLPILDKHFFKGFFMIFKTLTFLSAALLSFSTWSCPQLEGTYSCRVNGKVTETIITQDQRNGVWTFVVNNDASSMEVIVDGQDYPVANLGEIKNASYRAHCTAQQLTINAKGEMYSGNRNLGAGTLLMNFSKERGSDNLVATTTPSMRGFPLPSQTVNCPRL
jgi:hypothetical protein